MLGFLITALLTAGALADDLPRHSFADAVSLADAIYLGRVEKVHDLPDTGPAGYNRRAQLKVLRVFKGRPGPRAEVYFRRHVDKPWMDVPADLKKAGRVLIVFAAGRDFPHTDIQRGTVAFPYDPSRIEGVPEPLACKFRALEAFADLAQWERVISLAKCRKGPTAPKR